MKRCVVKLEEKKKKSRRGLWIFLILLFVLAGSVTAAAIISASRRDMMDSTLYLVGKVPSDGSYVENATSCSMCRRQIINAGIVKVVARIGEGEFTVTNVRDWVFNDDSAPIMPL